MNPIEILEKFGIPVTVAMAFGFFICEEKYLYSWQWGDYCGDNPTMVFIINVGNIYAEIEDEWDYKEFSWKLESLNELVEYYNKPNSFTIQKPVIKENLR